MLKKTSFKLLVLMSALVCLVINMTSIHVYADENTVGIAGEVYEFGEKDHYEFESTKGASGTSADNTYGEFFISGNIVPDNSAEGIPSFLVSTGNVSVTYSYSDSLLTATDEDWHLVEDKSKTVNGIKLDSNIKYGTVILQTSRDGEKWVDDTAITNAFKETPVQNDPFYQTKSTQLANGCYYRVVIAYILNP